MTMPTTAMAHGALTAGPANKQKRKTKTDKCLVLVLTPQGRELI
jgi:hypothetical protein